jgi:hypothetical protein
LSPLKIASHAGHTAMTEKTASLSEDYQALEQHLAAYGPDLSRWPVHARQRFAVLLASDATAQKLLHEAKALESVIERGLTSIVPVAQSEPEQPVRRLSLRDSVLQAAALEGAPGVASVMQPLNPAARFDPGAIRSIGSRRSGAAPHRPPQAFFSWPASVAMAAALVLGLMAGAQGLADRAFAPAGQLAPEFAGTANASDDDADDELAFDAGLGDFDEEGTL